MKEREVKKLHLLLIVIPIFLVVLGQTFVKIGSQYVSIQIFNLFDFLNIFIILGWLCLILRSIVWVLLLREFDISFIYPLISVSYIFILIVSVTFFNDSYTIGKVIGVILISIGASLIGLVKTKNNKNKKED